MQQIDEFDLIDKYLRNEMTPEEASAFEKTLARNEELRKEVEIRFDIMVGIRASEQNHILQELDKIDNQRVAKSKVISTSTKTQTVNSEQTNTKNNFNPIFVIVAVIALILLFVLKYVFTIF